MKHGKEKATLQDLPFFIVTNTKTSWKYYRTSDSKEITMDGEPITSAIGIYDLELIATQINSKALNVIRSKTVQKKFYSEKDFLSALYKVKDVYRNCAIDDVSSKITTTITFVVLKYITEQEAIHRTLGKNVMLWDDWRDENIDRDIKATIEDIQSSTAYKGVAEQLSINSALTASHCLEINANLVHSNFQVVILICTVQYMNHLQIKT